MEQQPNGQRRVALVIGSGAVKCAAALGMWKVLHREGIEIDMYVGCSGGSLFAAGMALGRGVEECIEMTNQLWDRRLTQERDYRSMLSAILPRLFNFDGRFGMVADGLVMEKLRVPFGDLTFADARHPLHIVATDLMNGEKVVVSEGRIRDAIRASIAIPYVWKPWKVGDRWLLDGCMSDPMPVDVAIREGADVILSMGFEAAYPKRISSATRFAFQINSIAVNNLLRANYAFHNLAHHTEIIPVLPEFGREIRLFDTQEIPYVIECGERATEERLPYLQRLLAGAVA
jgi:NTE family protein